MKKSLFLGILIGLIAPVQATYYEITTNIYTPGFTLQTGDSLYMTNGGFDSLNLAGESTAIIEGTSILEEGLGGIWYLDMFGSSNLNMSGGEVHELNPHNDATIFLSGEIIQRLKSSQLAWKTINEQLVWNPHITIECLDHFHNETTNVLTGHWLDSTPFSIQLIDVENYSPAIENIQFIPEPMTILLLGFGGLLLRSRKR